MYVIKLLQIAWQMCMQTTLQLVDFTMQHCHGYEQLECVHILCAYTMEIAHKFKLQMHTHKQQSIALAASYVLQQIIVSNHQLMQLDS